MSRRTQRLKFTSRFRALRKRRDVQLQATVRSTSHNVVVIETECHEIRLDGLPKNHARCAAETAALRDFVPTYDRCGSSLQIDAPAARARCPLYLQQRPNIGTATKRREVPIQDLSRCSKLSRLLDHLVGEREQLRWHFQTECLGSLEIDQ